MSFYVILPSNTRGESNRTNSFTVRLPRKLQFNSDWSVGLTVMTYPHSWPSMGTIEEQWIEVEWQNDDRSRYPVPCARFDTPLQLEHCLNNALLNEEIARPLIVKYQRLKAEKSAKERMKRQRKSSSDGAASQQKRFVEEAPLDPVVGDREGRIPVIMKFRTLAKTGSGQFYVQWRDSDKREWIDVSDPAFHNATIDTRVTEHAALDAFFRAKRLADKSAGSPPTKDKYVLYESRVGAPGIEYKIKWVDRDEFEWISEYRREELGPAFLSFLDERPYLPEKSVPWHAPPESYAPNTPRYKVITKRRTAEDGRLQEYVKEYSWGDNKILFEGWVDDTEEMKLLKAPIDHTKTKKITSKRLGADGREEVKVDEYTASGKTLIAEGSWIPKGEADNAKETAEKPSSTIDHAKTLKIISTYRTDEATGRKHLFVREWSPGGDTLINDGSWVDDLVAMKLATTNIDKKKIDYKERTAADGRKELYVEASWTPGGETTIINTDSWIPENEEPLAGELAPSPPSPPHSPTVDYDLAIQAIQKADKSFGFIYDKGEKRFRAMINGRFIREVNLSSQLSYLLGFSAEPLRKTELARYSPDLNGGISTLYVYAPELIEPVIVGDTTAPLLRLVNVHGKNDELVEDVFLPVQYHKLLVKEISDVHIEIRTHTGALMPFDYGACTLTLHFRKIAYF